MSQLLEARKLDPQQFWSVPSGVGKIASDSSGIVRLCYHDTLDFVAVKCIALNEDESLQERKIRILQDIGVVQQAGNDRIVRIHGYSVWNSSIGVIMEHLPRGSLGSLISNYGFQIDDVVLLRFARDISEGLAELHEFGSYYEVSRRNLTPYDIQLTEDLRCKIAFFGIGARNSRERTTCSGCEWRQRSCSFTNVDNAGKLSDVHSFGQILQFLTELPPSASQTAIRAAMHSMVEECTSDNLNQRPKMADLKSHITRLLRKFDVRAIHKAVGKLLCNLSEPELPQICTEIWPTLANFSVQENLLQSTPEKMCLNRCYNDETTPKLPIGRYGSPYSDQEKRAFSDETSMKEVTASRSGPKEHSTLCRKNALNPKCQHVPVKAPRSVKRSKQYVTGSYPPDDDEHYNDVCSEDETTVGHTNQNKLNPLYHAGHDQEDPYESYDTSDSEYVAKQHKYETINNESTQGDFYETPITSSPRYSNCKPRTSQLSQNINIRPKVPPRTKRPLGISYSDPCQTQRDYEPLTNFCQNRYSTGANKAVYLQPLPPRNQLDHVYDDDIQEHSKSECDNVPPPRPPKCQLVKSSSSPESFARSSSGKQSDPSHSTRWMELLGNRTHNLNPSEEHQSKHIGGKASSFKQSIQHLKDKDSKLFNCVKTDAFHDAYRKAKDACIKGQYAEMVKWIPCMYAQISETDESVWNCLINFAEEEKLKGNHIRSLLFLFLASYGYEKLNDPNGISQCVCEVYQLARNLMQQKPILRYVVLPYLKETCFKLERATPCNIHVKSYNKMICELSMSRVEISLCEVANAEATLSFAITDASSGAKRSSVYAFCLLELGKIYEDGFLDTEGQHRGKSRTNRGVHSRDECLNKARHFVSQAVEAFDESGDLLPQDRRKYVEKCKEKLRNYNGYRRS